MEVHLGNRLKVNYSGVRRKPVLLCQSAATVSTPAESCQYRVDVSTPTFSTSAYLTLPIFFTPAGSVAPKNGSLMDYLLRRLRDQRSEENERNNNTTVNSKYRVCACY